MFTPTNKEKKSSDSLRRKNEQLDLIQEELEVSYALLRQIIRRLRIAEQHADRTPSSLPRLEAALLLRYIESSNPDISASIDGLESSQQAEPPLSSDDQIRILSDKLMELELRYAKDWIPDSVILNK